MVRVVMADDEYYILRELETILDWQALGCTITGLARNGLEARELVINSRADLLITDIKMPGLDGLSLIKELYDRELPTEYIIVSGFSEFSCALTAIKYGVSDYLLKPIDPLELGKALDKFFLRHSGKNFREVTGEEDLRLRSNCNRFIKSAYEYVEEHYATNFSLKDVAEELMVSPSHLSKLFVSKLNRRFTKFVNLYRIKISQQFLKATDKTIEEIAELVGYSDYKYYSVVFKSITGMTPAQFRQEKNYFVNF